MELFRELTHVSQGVRRLGAASVDLCHVALGIVDAYWEYRLKPWDVAGGLIVVTEAGGRATTMCGRPYRCGPDLSAHHTPAWARLVLPHA